MIFLLVYAVGWLRTPTEIEREKDDELARLRALAREHNLPMGDER